MSKSFICNQNLGNDCNDFDEILYGGGSNKTTHCFLVVLRLLTFDVLNYSTLREISAKQTVKKPVLQIYWSLQRFR